MSAIVLKTAKEIELMRESALIVSKTLGMLAGEIKPGISTLALDAMAEAFIRDQGAEPGFLGLYDFPNTLCMSPNTQVVHGIPNNDPLQGPESADKNRSASARSVGFPMIRRPSATVVSPHKIISLGSAAIAWALSKLMRRQ